MKIFKTAHYMAIISLLSGYFFVSLIIYWSLKKYNPLTVNRVEVLNENNEVKKGDLVYIKVCFEKHTDITPEIQRKLVDGVIYDLGKVASVTNEVGEGINIVAIEVPDKIFTGEYNIDFRSCYKMNPIRQPICIDYSSPTFKIID